jgi:predicted dehydrogenase
MNRIRVGVVGLGTMGKNHLRVLSDLDQAMLVAVCDSNHELSSWIGQKYAVQAYTSCVEMFTREHLDAVVIAAPTRYHADIGKLALAIGVHVLMEKPIASDLCEARQLTEVADNAQRVLMIGHIERFNPAVRELRRRLAAGELGRVFRVHTRRCGPFPTRIRDVGVVIDLATHDLDIMTYLLRSAPARLFAEIEHRIHTEHEDMLNALIRFEDGIVGVLEVDWLTPARVRNISVLGERGLFHVDYLTQELMLYENEFANMSVPSLPSLSGVSEGNMTRFHIRRGEPLRFELEAFLRAVAGEGEAEPSAEDGSRALRLAIQLVESGRRSMPIVLGSSSGDHGTEG